jgi:uncharacterized ferritin-like protein (DUF455 family)
MDAAGFIAQLASENESILKRLAPAQALGVEARGDLSPRNLLRIALKNELEASEIAALWMPSARGAELKLALARQAGDEARHYRLIVERLHDLGDDLEGFDPLAQGYSPLFKFLSTLENDVERVAAGQFTREAIALVKNVQFIELCERAGDVATSLLYRGVIQPDEQHHHQLGRHFLARLAVDEKSQQMARAAHAHTLTLAEELQTLAFQRAGVHHAPGC